MGFNYLVLRFVLSYRNFDHCFKLQPLKSCVVIYTESKHEKKETRFISFTPKSGSIYLHSTVMQFCWGRIIIEKTWCLAIGHNIFFEVLWGQTRVSKMSTMYECWCCCCFRRFVDINEKPTELFLKLTSKFNQKPTLLKLFSSYFSNIES